MKREEKEKQYGYGLAAEHCRLIAVKYFSVEKQDNMAMLQLYLLAVLVVQLTSPQPTYDVIQRENDVSSCGRTDPVLSELSTAMSQLATAVSRIEVALSQLQSEVAELKALSQPTAVAGTHSTLNRHSPKLYIC